MYDVITVGSATVDVIADSDSELIKIKSSHDEEELIAYPAGSKILITNLEYMTGGGGTNTAVAFSRLGHKVAYLGNLGIDFNTRFILEKLKEEKIDFIGVKDKGMCGFSVVLKSLDHDRTILAYKGMNNDLTLDEVKFSRLKTKWFYFSSMMGKSFSTQEKIAEFAEKNNINIAFNPSSYLAKKGSEYLENIFQRTTVLILNREEAELLVGKGNLLKIMKKLISLGPQSVIVTEGKKGAHGLFGEMHYFLTPNKVKVVDSTGAGDAFASSFISGIIKKDNPEFALQLAQVNAESVIQYPGAKNKLLSYRKALSKLKEKPYKIKKKKINF